MEQSTDKMSSWQHHLSCLALCLLGVALIGTDVDLAIIHLPQSVWLGSALIVVGVLLSVSRVARRRA